MRRYNNSTDRVGDAPNNIPFVVLESILYRAERREKRLCAVAATACAVAIIACLVALLT